MPGLPHVFDDPDDLLRRELHPAVEMHELSYRVLVAEQSLDDEVLDLTHLPLVTILLPSAAYG